MTNLVEVWGNNWYDGDTRKERMYVETPDLQIYACNREFSHTFNLPTNVWVPVDSIPEDAFFIGRYERPANLPVA
jgi:hypothetical protein